MNFDYLSVKLTIAKVLGLVFSVGTMFLIFIQYNFSIELIFSLLSYASIIIHDRLLLKKLEKKKLDFEKERVYIINRVPNLNAELIFSLIFYLVIIVTEFPPFFDMMWYFIPWALIRYASKRINIDNEDGFFLVLEKDRLIKHLEVQSYYEFSELIAIRVMDDKVLVNAGSLSLPIYMKISQSDKEKMKAFFAENAESIHAKY